VFDIPFSDISEGKQVTLLILEQAAFSGKAPKNIARSLKTLSIAAAGVRIKLLLDLLENEFHY
jgi:hypothetical protein